MLYSELLAQQDNEVSKLHSNHRDSYDQIRQMQKEHFAGDKYGPELKRLEEAFKRDLSDIDKRHKQERKDFLNEPERAPEKPKVKDMDTAYNKTVTIEIDGLRPETKEERIERKMREWDESQLEKTQQRDNTRSHSL